MMRRRRGGRASDFPFSPENLVNLGVEKEFPIAQIFLKILAKNNSTNSRIEGKDFTHCKNTTSLC